MNDITIEVAKNLMAAARSRYINMSINKELFKITDWNFPIRPEDLPTENILFCFAVIKLSQKRNIPTRMMLVNTPKLNVVCIVDDKYVINLSNRDIVTKKYAKNFLNYIWLYLSDTTINKPWTKVIE